ncbi:hypothetical protein [Amycolatopsis sp. lyj-23]|uniref:hypothetical protein n=1 Tax=Amycolatopsis sp. lyj-23 TaxID=2789283 RepID=UPI00397B7D74
MWPDRRPGAQEQWNDTVHDAFEMSARAEQGLVDAEVRASRRAILAAVRPVLRRRPQTLADASFLTLADREVVYSAIAVAAQCATRASACALHVPDARTGALNPVREADTAVSAAALPTPGLSGGAVCGPAEAQVLAAGFEAASTYSLRDPAGQLLGVLTVYFRAAGNRPAPAELVAAASRAMAHVQPRDGEPGETR